MILNIRITTSEREMIIIDGESSGLCKEGGGDGILSFFVNIS
jgi:hypothetical protein